MGKDQVQSPTLAAPAMPSGFRTPNSSSLLRPLTMREEEEQVAALAARIGGHTTLDELIRHSDLKNIDGLVNLLNQGRDTPATPCIFGKLVPKDHFGVISKNGTTSVVGPGRYFLYNHRATWVGEPVAINGDLRSVTRGPVTVLRVPNGHYGLATLGNKPLILSSENGGLHAFLTAQFRFQEFVRIDTRSISHGSLHIVRVPRGSYASVTESDIPGFLPPGVHAFNSATFNFVRVHELGHAPIRHQTITRFYVPEGSIGLAWHDSDPVFCTQAGVYLVDSPMFEFVRTVDYGEPHIALGARKIVTVQEGQVGVSHRNGELAVLPPGRHDIADPRHTFDEFLSTQQQCLTLAKEDQHSEQMMRCESKELASIGVQASVFYHIRDPRLAIVKIGSRRNIERFINETATAVITTIIRSTPLSDMARTTTSKTRNDEVFDPSTGPFFDRLKTDFIARLQENFDMEYGIFILYLWIRELKVLDTELDQSVSAEAAALPQANVVDEGGSAGMGRVQADSHPNTAPAHGAREPAAVLISKQGGRDTDSLSFTVPAMPSGFRTPNSSSLLQPLTEREEEVQVAALAARIGGHMTLDDCIMHSVFKNVEDIVNRLNGPWGFPPPAGLLFGRVIPKDHLGVVSMNDTTSVVGPGRYPLWNARAHWVGEPIAINGDLRSVTRGPVTVLRVPNGHYGLATLGNKPLILSSENGGLHAFLTAQFRFQEFVRIDTRSISHGSLHIVRVPRGSYASVTESGIPGFLPPGVHAFNSATFNFVRVHELGHAPIRHQTITRFHVPEGSIGLAWHDSDPVFCTQAGVYLVDSPMFEFVRTVDYGEPHIALGARKIVTVQEGQVGVSHRNGELAVLPPGRHDIADPRHTFDEFLSTQQQCLTLAKEDQHSEQRMRCESKELASIGVQASVFYHIRDPRLAIVKIGSRRNIERFINEMATAVITTIIRSTSLDVALTTKRDSRPVFDRLKTDFIARLQEFFDKEYGIFILNVELTNSTTSTSAPNKGRASQR